MPDGAVYVGRPSRWGNPFPLSAYRREFPWLSDREQREYAVREFTMLVSGSLDWLRRYIALPDAPSPADIAALRGHDLACWCPPGPCHADVLLDLANA